MSIAWTLTTHLEKKIDGAYTRMLRTALNRSWKDHPTNVELYGHIPPISESLQQQRMRFAGHCWHGKEELARDVYSGSQHIDFSRKDAQKRPTCVSWNTEQARPDDDDEWWWWLGEKAGWNAKLVRCSAQTLTVDRSENVTTKQLYMLLGFVFTLYTLSSVCIFFKPFYIHFLGCLQGEFV